MLLPAGTGRAPGPDARLVHLREGAFGQRPAPREVREKLPTALRVHGLGVPHDGMYTIYNTYSQAQKKKTTKKRNTLTPLPELSVFLPSRRPAAPCGESRVGETRPTWPTRVSPKKAVDSAQLADWTPPYPAASDEAGLPQRPRRRSHPGGGSYKRLRSTNNSSHAQHTPCVGLIHSKCMRAALNLQVGTRANGTRNPRLLQR
jgi:hypothetical protein